MIENSGTDFLVSPGVRLHVRVERVASAKEASKMSRAKKQPCRCREGKEKQQPIAAGEPVHQTNTHTEIPGYGRQMGNITIVLTRHRAGTGTDIGRHSGLPSAVNIRAE